MAVWSANGRELNHIENEALEWAMIIDEGREKYGLSTFTVVEYLKLNWQRRLQFYDIYELVRQVHKDLAMLKRELQENTGMNQ